MSSRLAVALGPLLSVWAVIGVALPGSVGLSAGSIPAGNILFISERDGNRGIIDADSSDQTFLWGDVDCDGQVNPIDSLKILRHDAGLEVQQPAGCPNVGELLFWTGIFPAAGPAGVGELGVGWGDHDCNESADPIDALRGLRYDAGFPVTPVQGCPDLGEEGTIRQPDEIVMDDNFFQYDGALNPEITVTANSETLFAAVNAGDDDHNLHVDVNGDGYDSCAGDICTSPEIVPPGAEGSLRVLLPAGTFGFRCDIHPDEMTGTFSAE
jgi:hypothetical protein